MKLIQHGKQVEYCEVAGRARVAAFFGGLQGGKCLSPSQGVLMFGGGVKEAGEIEVGDEVFGYESGGGVGERAVVTEVGRFEKEVWECELFDGSKVRATADHRFLAWNEKAKRVEERQFWEMWRPEGRKGVQYHLAFLSPMDLESCVDELPVDAYVLGLILGDGGITQRTVQFTTADEELVEALAEESGGSGIVRIRSSKYGWRLGESYRDGRGHGRNRLIDKLRGLGLMGCSSHTKFIPEMYLRAGREDRKKLLAGLIDTDGSVEDRSVDYGTCSRALAEGVQFLVRSLGGRCRIRERVTKCQTGAVCHSYRIGFTLNERLPLRVHRKVVEQGCGGWKRHQERRRAKSYRRVGVESCVDISIDHPSHLFLLDNFVVTHNTLSGADALGLLLYGGESGGREVTPTVRLPEQLRGTGVEPEVWILSKSYTLARQAWGYFKWRWGECVMDEREIRRAGLRRGDAYTHWLRPGLDGVPIRLTVRTAHDPEELRAAGTLLVAWCDEVAHWPELAWMNLQGRGIVTKTRYLVTTTPNGRNWLYRDVYLPGLDGTDPDVGVVTCRSDENPFADKAYIEKLRKRLGVAYAEQELDALFVESAGLVYSFDRSRQMKRPPAGVEFDLVVCGYDPGYGDACAVTIWGRSNGVWYGLKEFKQAKRTTDELVGMFRGWVNQYGVSRIFVDKRRPSDMLLLRRAGLPAQANVELHGEDDRRTVLPMVRYIEGMIRSDRLFISPDMEQTAEEFESYHYPDREDRARGENPVKWRDDLMDSLRYSIASVEKYLPDLNVRRNGKTGEYEVEGTKAVRREIRMPTVQQSLSWQEKAWDEKERELWSPN